MVQRVFKSFDRDPPNQASNQTLESATLPLLGTVITLVFTLLMLLYYLIFTTGINHLPGTKVYIRQIQKKPLN
jgi:hypothetical protein